MKHERRGSEITEKIVATARRIPITGWFVGSIVLGVSTVTLLMFSTSSVIDPEYKDLDTGVVTESHTKNLIVGVNKTEEESVPASSSKVQAGSTDRGMSGYTFSGNPAEVMFLSAHGEKGFVEANMKKSSGDKGQAYGIMQFDYRYDLVAFMNFAYAKHPNEWSGFKPYLSYRKGDTALVSNSGIEQAFAQCYDKNPSIYVGDQLERMRTVYFNDSAKQYLKDKTGIDVDSRGVAVESAFLSAEINNCKGMDWYISNGGLNNNMTDAEIIHGIYQTVRTRRSFDRFKENGEEDVAKKMLTGEVKVTGTYINGTPWASWAPGWDGALAVRLSDQGE